MTDFDRFFADWYRGARVDVDELPLAARRAALGEAAEQFTVDQLLDVVRLAHGKDSQASATRGCSARSLQGS